jgi:hypothetical protein
VAQKTVRFSALECLHRAQAVECIKSLLGPVFGIKLPVDMCSGGADGDPARSVQEQRAQQVQVRRQRAEQQSHMRHAHKSWAQQHAWGAPAAGQRHARTVRRQQLRRSKAAPKRAIAFMNT